MSTYKKSRPSEKRPWNILKSVERGQILPPIFSLPGGYFLRNLYFWEVPFGISKSSKLCPTERLFDFVKRHSANIHRTNIKAKSVVIMTNRKVAPVVKFNRLINSLFSSNNNSNRHVINNLSSRYSLDRYQGNPRCQ